MPRYLLPAALAALPACNFGSSGANDASSDADDVVAPDAVRPRADAMPSPADAAPLAPTKVLVLGDHDPVSAAPDAGAQVIAALTTAGLEVTDGGYYAAWDATAPDPADFDVVYLLQGENYASPLADPTLADHLLAFVSAGGTLVRTEWAGYMLSDAPGDPFATITATLPVTYDDAFGYVSTWQAAAGQGGHPYLDGVSLPMSTISGYSQVTASPGAEVLAELSTTDAVPLVIPALVVAPLDLGRLVYLNHDLTYSMPELDPGVLTVLTNIALAEPGTP